MITKTNGGDNGDVYSFIDLMVLVTVILPEE